MTQATFSFDSEEASTSVGKKLQQAVDRIKSNLSPKSSSMASQGVQGGTQPEPKGGVGPGLGLAGRGASQSSGDPSGAQGVPSSSASASGNANAPSATGPESAGAKPKAPTVDTGNSGDSPSGNGGNSGNNGGNGNPPSGMPNPNVTSPISASTVQYDDKSLYKPQEPINGRVVETKDGYRVVVGGIPNHTWTGLQEPLVEKHPYQTRIPGSSHESKVLPYREKGFEIKLSADEGVGIHKWCLMYSYHVEQRGHETVYYLRDPDDQTVMRHLLLNLERHDRKSVKEEELWPKSKYDIYI